MTSFSPPSDKSVPTAPRPFDVYAPGFATSATYSSSPKPILAGGTEVLTVTQKFLFGSYGVNPPHEPGAVLSAARMFPLVSFSLKGDGSGKVVRYIRFDIRAHFNLDNLGYDSSNRQKMMKSGQDVRGFN